MLVYQRVNPMNTGNGGFLSHGSTPKSSKSSIYRWIFHNKPSSELGVPPFMEPPYILLYHVVHQPLVNSPKYQIYIHLPNINIVFHGWVNISGWWIWNMFFFHILGIIIPTDWYFSEGLKPPTRFVVWCDIPPTIGSVTRRDVPTLPRRTGIPDKTGTFIGMGSPYIFEVAFEVGKRLDLWCRYVIISIWS